MMYTRTNDLYKIARSTGNQSNLLGVSFAENSDSEKTPETITWDLKNGESIRTSAAEVLSQVISGLKLVNQTLVKNYQLSKIYYVPEDSPKDSVYEFLIIKLIKHYHSDRKFKEV